MADCIDREAFIGWLKTIPLKDLSDGLGLCRVIMEEDFKRCIKNIPQSAFIDAVPVKDLEALVDFFYIDGCISKRYLTMLHGLIDMHKRKDGDE